MGTTRYTIQVGDEHITFEGPDNLTDRQIERLADTQLRHAKPGQTFSHSIYVGPTGDQPAHSPDESSAVGSFMRGGVSGLFSNFGDELAAAGNAAIPGLASLENATTGEGQLGPSAGGSFWDRFQKNMDVYQAQKAADEALHPTASHLGEFVGAGSQAVLGGKAIGAIAPEAVSAYASANPIKTAGLAAGGMGAASAAGAGRGNRAQSAALGFVLGAPLGLGLSSAIEFAPAAAQYAKVMFNKGVNAEAIRQLAQALKRDQYDVTSPSGVAKLQAFIQQYTGKPVSLADVGTATRARTGVGLRSPSEQQDIAIQNIVARSQGAQQRLAGDIRATVAPRTDVHALEQDLINQREAAAGPLKEKAMFEPATPPQPKGLFREVSRDPNGNIMLEYQPSPGKAPIPIKMGIDNGVAEIAVNQFGKGKNRLGPAQIRAAMEDLQAMYPEIKTFGGFRRSGAGAGRVQEITPPPLPTKQARIVDDPVLQQLARLPLAQRALTGALTQAEAERSLLAATGQSTAHLPDLNRGSQLDMRTFDYLKRFLDDETNRLYKKGDTSTFSAAEAQQVKALRNTIRDRLKEYNPDYKDYLNAYSGSSEMIDALQAGQEFGQQPAERIAAEQAGRSAAGQELFRVGSARSLLDDIRNARHTNINPANAILQSPEAEAQLAATGINPADFNTLKTRVEQERNLAKLPAELQGAATAQRIAAARDAESAAPNMRFNPGSPVSITGAFIKNIGGRFAQNRNAAVNEAFLPMATATDPATIQATINILEQHGQLQAAAALRRSLEARYGSTIGGTLIGGPVSLPTLEDNYGR